MFFYGGHVDLNISCILRLMLVWNVNSDNLPLVCRSIKNQHCNTICQQTCQGCDNYMPVSSFQHMHTKVSNHVLFMGMYMIINMLSLPAAIPIKRLSRYGHQMDHLRWYDILDRCNSVIGPSVLQNVWGKIEKSEVRLRTEIQQPYI